MQRTAFPRRRPLVSVIVGLAGAVLAGAAALAAPLAGNLIGVYQFNTLNTVNDLTGAAATSGTSSRGELLMATDGNFYAAMGTGGVNGAGAIMRVTPAGTATVVHAFKGDATEGISPFAGPIQGSDGNLYGTTFSGGTQNLGTVYKLGLDGTYTNLYSFTTTSQGAYNPYAGLVQGPDGALYGTALSGGTSKLGVVFRITTDGTLTVLLNFSGANGANPEGQLVVGIDGALYGTTMNGGTADRGTLYKITTTGTHTVLYSFSALITGGPNGRSTNAVGANPRAGLRQGSDGTFYGTTYQGGPSGQGTVFKATPAGVVTLVHDFAGSPADGAFPLSPVTVLADGTLYGTTISGGFGGLGVAWRQSPTGSFQVLHSFSAGAFDGSTPYSGLLPLAGYLWGVNYGSPGATIPSYGALYKIDEGTGGVPPVTLSVAPEVISLGASATLTWSSPTAATCAADGAWTDTITTAGTQVVTPTTAGVYSYVVNCTDGAGVIRTINQALVVTAPAAQTVDGGASIGGGGALGLWSLTLLGGAAGALARRRRKTGSL